MIELSTLESDTTLYLTPNRSASWQQTKYLMLGFAIVVFTIAVAWSVVGAWVILPFAGVEVIALAITMYFVSRSTYQWEQVTLTPYTVVITNSRGTNLRIARPDTYLFFIEDTSNRKMPRLIFKSSNVNAEVGAFLNNSDKCLLLKHLDEAGIIICKSKWW
ncbi:hypothetical protein D210916BOD24_09920 [Alteromonas sp. D210916BOD_24]|uniref:DUF2244 domain-containing protein n=1 Tax=Alteromonas sp. D210916BOD_24 TaxID=3157618 RepID=UPI00399C9136